MGSNPAWRVLQNMAKIPVRIDELLQRRHKEYLKVYLVFKFKEYSWKAELQNSFSISNSTVNEGLKLLEREGHLISKDFWSLDLDKQEMIRRLNGAYFNRIASYPKIYVLSSDEICKGWWEVNQEDIYGLIKGDASMEHSMNLIMENKKACDIVQKEQETLENSQNERERTHWEEGVPYITMTGRWRRIEEEKKRAFEKKGRGDGTKLTLPSRDRTEVVLYEFNGKSVSKEFFTEKEKELLEMEKDDVLEEEKVSEVNNIKEKIRKLISRKEVQENITGEYKDKIRRTKKEIKRLIHTQEKEKSIDMIKNIRSKIEEELKEVANLEGLLKDSSKREEEIGRELKKEENFKKEYEAGVIGKSPEEVNNFIEVRENSTKRMLGVGDEIDYSKFDEDKEFLLRKLTSKGKILFDDVLEKLDSEDKVIQFLKEIKSEGHIITYEEPYILYIGRKPKNGRSKNIY